MTHLILTWSWHPIDKNEAKEEIVEDDGLDTVAVTEEIIEGKRLEWIFYYLSFKYTQLVKLAKNLAGGRGGRIELQTKSIIY